MIHSFSSEQNKGHILHRKCSDVFQWQPHRFSCLLSLFFLCHVEKWTLLSDPISLPERFLVAAGEGPLVMWLETSIVRTGGRKWSGSLSTVSLNTQQTARPSHCQQAQLGQALRWSIVQWGLHIFMAMGVSLWRPEGVQGGNRLDQRGTYYFYYHVGPQSSCNCRQKYLGAVESWHERKVVTADDEITGLFM